MVTLKVKLRPSSVEGKAGTIYYSVSHRRVVRHITTKIHLMPEDWNEEKQCILSEEATPDRRQNRIDSDMAALRRIVRELENRPEALSADNIVCRFRDPERHVSVLPFIEEQIRFLTDCARLGTATNYRRAAAALAGFLNGRDLYFDELTLCFVEGYKDYLLHKGLTRNSVSFHMRILRAVYNKAVRRGYTEQTFPFREVYTGIDRTRKRAVSEHVISRLMRLELDDRPCLSLARDLFLFSFYTRGMAFVDMAYLLKSDIQDGAIHYARHKTGQQLTIRVEPCMQTIIERHAAEGTPFVFPLLDRKDPVACFRRYKTELRLYNARLAKISELMGLKHHLSSYASRHSWATLARDRNIPMSVISAGMGHSSERTTQIYLTTLENSLIDNANRRILESLDITGAC